jgi:hypothetical protein
MRAMSVVVAGELGQDLTKMPLAEDQDVIEHSRRSVPTNRSAYEFARGDRTGVLITRVAFPAKTWSNAAVNLRSRSRIKNLNRPAWSPRSMSRLRACWVVQAPAGCAVTPKMCSSPWMRR